MPKQAVASTPVSRADISILSQVMSLYEDQPNSVVNRALVIHANADDLGRGNNPESLKNGNSGAHIACGLLVLVDTQDFDIDLEGKQESQHSVNSRHMDRTPLKGWEDSSRLSHLSSNMHDIEGIMKPDLPHDSFELKSAVSTQKGISFPACAAVCQFLRCLHS